MLKLIFELNYPFLSSLEVKCFLSKLAFESLHTLERIIESYLSIRLLHLPAVGDLFYFLNLTLLKECLKLGLFSSLPHLELPDCLVVAIRCAI
jgi:hypothetical protein